VNAEPVRYLYILSSHSRRLYVGSTANLLNRVWQHRHGLIPGFTLRYAISRLVYYESTQHVRAALERERQVKAWRRHKKLCLIEGMNAG
jgi:putative endonuclease